MINPPSCCYSSVTPNDLDPVLLWHCSSQARPWKMWDTAEDKQVRDCGRRKETACSGFPPSLLQQSSNMASTHFQSRLSQFLCFRLTVFANSSLFGENGCNSMNQNSYCQYCNNHIFAFRSDLTPDLVHHTTDNQTQKPQCHDCSRTDGRLWVLTWRPASHQQPAGPEPHGPELWSWLAPTGILGL